MRKQWGVIAAVIFTAALAIACGFLLFDTFYRGPLQHALMNVEGIIALSFLGLAYARGAQAELTRSAARLDAVAIALIVTAVAAAFIPNLQTPFLYDDFTHITDASGSTWRTAAAQFGQSAGRGLFFRPLGFLFYWLYYLWAGADPTWWHAGNIGLHAVCAALTYLLCREIGLSLQASIGGALLFGLAGVSAEAVAWVDAGFVMLATAFVLLSLIFVCRYAATGRLAWLVGAFAAGGCGMLCKETAFSLPFLVASLALFKDRSSWNRIGRVAIVSGVLTAVLFAYRWWALRGIGGYEVAGGQPNVLHFNLVRSIDALLLRQWAVLFFPFNWTVPSGPMLRAALAVTPFLLAIFAWIASPPRRQMIGCFVFIVAAALPVQHLLLISPDLGGSRTLYLGCVGLALLWGLVLETMPRIPRIAAAVVLLVIQCSILEHDLRAWRETSELAHSVCIAFGQKIAGTSGPVVVRGLPSIRNGAVFLRNGFPQCVELNTGVPGWRIQVSDSGVPQPGAREFHWNGALGRVLP